MREPYLPHAAPLRFITGIERTGSRDVRAQARVQAPSPALSEGRLRPAYLIEVVAQTAAAADSPLPGQVQEGMLVAVRTFRSVGDVAADEVMDIVLTEDGSLGPATRYQAEIHCGSRLVAKGVIQVQRTT
jgi:predicted hotdog family 3-hydroxylacyl-ACP dehydratase